MYKVGDKLWRVVSECLSLTVDPEPYTVEKILRPDNGNGDTILMYYLVQREIVICTTIGNTWYPSATEAWEAISKM